MIRAITLIILLFFTDVAAGVTPSVNHGITFVPNDSRLGDQLVCYLHVKWLEYKYGMTLYFIPFPYSELFQFHHTEKRLSPEIVKSFSRALYVLKIEQFEPRHPQKTLYKIPYFPESEHDRTLKDRNYIYFPVDWKDPTFKAIIQQALTPVVPLDLITPPEDRLSVAVHVRTGGSYAQDNEIWRNRCPLKFPPDAYYIEQIRAVNELYGHAPLYVYIFTDDSYPEEIARRFSTALQADNIVFDYRKGEHAHDKNVLEDLYSLLNFRCLIRPDSNFSLIAEKIGNFELTITPDRKTQTY